jgi:hypothetical protein
MHGYFLCPSILGLGLDLTKRIGIFHLHMWYNCSVTSLCE